MTERVPIPEDINAFDEQSRRSFMVTRRKDGSPTCHPMALFSLGGEAYYNMYSTSVKHKNLTRDPRICILVTTPSDDKSFTAAVLRGRARNLSVAETLSADATPAVIEARGISMEGVKSVEDAPEKFIHEEPEDWLKRAAVMVERIRDGVRMLWEIRPEEAGWLTELRKEN